MSKKTMCLTITLIIVLIGMLGLACRVQRVEAGGKIYIRADGSVDPSSANITSIGNVIYTFTGDIFDEIEIQRDNIVVDGAGYMLQGVGNGTGMDLSGRSNITIMDMEIKAFEFGIRLNHSSDNVISGNTLTNNNLGVPIIESSNNTISRNNIIGNKGWGVYLWLSSNNIISENNVTANDNGVDLDSSSNNSVSRNSIAGNKFKGILLPYSSNYNIVSGNTVTINELGIRLSYSSNNNLTGNNITNNEYGIELFNSSNNILRDNNIAGNRYNLGVWGWTLTGFMNDVDISNTVDGKPVYHWVNKRNMSVPLDAGYVALVNCTCITVQDLTLFNNTGTIVLAFTTNSMIQRNNITNNTWGIGFFQSSSNTISENKISNNFLGINLEYSSDNNAFRNSLTKNRGGIALSDSTNNTIYHNNFINNLQYQASTYESANVWDNGVEGNYWSDYDGTDSDYDGLGDIPYDIDENNQDDYPLMGTFSRFNVTWEEKAYDVNTICNSTISDFKFDDATTTLRFDVTSPDETVGFCRIMVPKALMKGPYTVYVDENEVRVNELYISNTTHTFLYFQFIHSTHAITIVSWTERYERLLEDFQNLNSTLYERVILLDIFTVTTVIFVATTVILAATTVYFAIRKPKTKPETQ